MLVVDKSHISLHNDSSQAVYGDTKRSVSQLRSSQRSRQQAQFGGEAEDRHSLLLCRDSFSLHFYDTISSLHREGIKIYFYRIFCFFKNIRSCSLRHGSVGKKTPTHRIHAGCFRGQFGWKNCLDIDHSQAQIEQSYQASLDHEHYITLGAKP